MTNEYAKDGVRGKGGKQGELTVQPGWEVQVESLTGKITVHKKSSPGEQEKVYQAGSIGKSVQELWVNGGLEGFIKASL